MMEAQVDPQNNGNYILFWEEHYQVGIQKIKEMKGKMQDKNCKQEVKSEQEDMD